jgi:hypothetical protein
VFRHLAQEVKKKGREKLANGLGCTFRYESCGLITWAFVALLQEGGMSRGSRRAGKQESRKAGKQESRKAGKWESGKVEKWESRKEK